MAAFYLSRAGIPSLILEKTSFPRPKVCGDILTSNVLRAIHEAEPDWMQDLINQPWTMNLEATAFGGTKKAGFVMPFNSPSNQAMGLPSCLTARRHDFDHWLFEKVKAEPLVEILEDCPVKSIRKKGEGFVLESKQGEFAASYLLLATGANSPLTKMLVPGQEILPRHSAVGLRMYFKNSEPHAQKSLSEYYLFDRKFMPGGLYVTPFSDGGVNVNAVMRLDTFNKRRPKLQELAMDFLNAHPELGPRFMNAEQEGAAAGCTLFFGTKRRPISAGNCLLLGDAAGLTDATNANGIGHAMISGQIAAKRVVAAIAAGMEISGYDEAVFARLRNSLKAGRVMKSLFANPLTAGISVAVLNASLNRINSKAVEELVYSANTTKTLLRPGFYWRLLK